MSELNKLLLAKIDGKDCFEKKLEYLNTLYLKTTNKKMEKEILILIEKLKEYMA